MRKTDLPEIDEIVFAVSEAPLGESAKAPKPRYSRFIQTPTLRYAKD